MPGPKHRATYGERTTKRWTDRDRGLAEGYAAAMDDILEMFAESMSGKSYDPMTIVGGTIHSYAFDLKDGGRHHPLTDYKSVAELCALVRKETVESLNEAKSELWGEWHESRRDVPISCWRDHPDVEEWRRDRYNALRLAQIGLGAVVT